ncbi:MAG TPA: hypothetical protein VK548_10800 [Candidatus Acidoferrum sp.]|nr:hypothetical protein [Candidatus Acidoferrum sp.]
MAIGPVQALKVGLIAWFVTSSLLLSVGTSAGTSVGGISPQISIAASDARLLIANYTTAGSVLFLDVMVLAQDATPFSSDVYVGILSPDGHSTSLLVDQAPPFFNVVPALVTGPPVPLLANVVLDKDTGGRLVIPNFAAGGPQGWYVIYGLIVGAGRDPGDPKQWASSSFFPILVTPRPTSP